MKLWRTHNLLKGIVISVLCGLMLTSCSDDGSTLQFNIDGDQQQVNTADISVPATSTMARMRLAGKME